MPVVHPADLWRRVGRYQKIGPEMVRFKDRGRTRHGPGHDPRGGRRRPAARHGLELPAAADARLPLPDQVPRRAALARRADPRPRVRHEGLLLAATATPRGWTSATSCTTTPTPGSSSAWASRRSPWRRCRDHGRYAWPTSSWSSTSGARTPSSSASAATTPPTSRSRRSTKPEPAAEEPMATEEVATPGTATIADLAAFLEHRTRTAPPRRPSSSPGTGAC